MRLFNETLAAKPQVVAINKMDITEVREIAPLLEEFFVEEGYFVPKADMDGQDIDRYSEPQIGEGTLHFVSAATHSGVDGLLDSVLAALDAVDEVDASLAMADAAARDLDSSSGKEQGDLPVLRPRPRREQALVRRRGDVFIVQAQRAVRIAAVLNDGDWNARMQFLGYLQRAGVVRALEQAGALPGDTVRFGEVEWEWE